MGGKRDLSSSVGWAWLAFSWVASYLGFPGAGSPYMAGVGNQSLAGAFSPLARPILLHYGVGYQRAQRDTCSRCCW